MTPAGRGPLPPQPGPAAAGTPREPVLVLGVGNELFTDEGLGIVAAQRIAGLNLPGVRVLDGGTLGLALLPEIVERDALLILDAIVSERARPGEVVVLHGDDVSRAGELLMSAHQIGVGDALAAAEFAGRRPARLAAVGMVPASLDTGYGLSPTVRDGLGAVVGQALRLLADWGVEVPADA